jgi:transposase
MARYKDASFDQSKLIPIVLSQQITPGTFEYAVTLLVDEHLDMTIFDSRYNNDEVGRLAYHPAMLLRVILSAYARGFTSSRQIEQLCKENVVFMALAADSQPHFTTFAKFIAHMSDVIQPLFTEVLMVCDQQGLIGGDMFAIDGCKLPSNASKEWSGTHKEMTKKQRKIDRAVRRMLSKHREEDATGQDNDHTRRTAEEKNIASLRAASRKIKKFCTATVDRTGISGKVVKSNITDNESASMLTSHGALQGFNGVAAVDDKHQIVIAAEAFGQGPENNLLKPMIEQVIENLGRKKAGNYQVTADAGFHSKSMLEFCVAQKVDAYIADGNFRKRDPNYKWTHTFSLSP